MQTRSASVEIDGGLFEDIVSLSLQEVPEWMLSSSHGAVTTCHRDNDESSLEVFEEELGHLGEEDSPCRQVFDVVAAIGKEQQVGGLARIQ